MGKRIVLVPLDGSELSEHILDHPKDLMCASAKDTRLILLRVVEPVVTLYAGGSNAGMVSQDIQKQAEDDAISYLKDLKNRLTKRKISVQTEIITGDPPNVILDYINNNDVDLVAMSTHGRSGISRWYFGSVAEKVIRHSKVPVLVSPPSGTRNK